MQEFYEYIKSVYGDLYKSITGNDISEIYSTLSSKLLELNDINMRDEFNKNNISKFKEIKRNWINTYVRKQGGKYNDDIITATNIYKRETQGLISTGTFKEIFSFNTLQEYKEHRMVSLKQWLCDSNSRFVDFEGFHLLYKPAKIKGIQSDIILEYYKYLVAEKKSKITKVPSFLSSIGVDITNKALFISDNEIEELENRKMIPSTYDKVIISEDKTDELIMQLENEIYLRLQNDKLPTEIITQITLLKAVKDFNTLDAEIINLFYTKLYNVVSGKEIYISIADIAQELGYQLRAERFKVIKDSLCKLSSLNLISDDYSGNRLIGHLLDTTIIETEEGTKARVYLGNFLRELVMMDSTFNFNKTVYNKLSGAGQQIAVWLQNRRLKRIAKCEDNKEELTISYLATAINLSIFNTSRARKRITEVLEELKKNKLVIKDYSIMPKSECITIEYMDLPFEIKDRIRNHQFKSDELVEGDVYSE